MQKMSVPIGMATYYLQPDGATKRKVPNETGPYFDLDEVDGKRAN